MQDIDDNMPEQYQIAKEKRIQDNIQILEYNQKVAQDAIEYVKLLNEIFIKKVGGRRPRGIVCDQVVRVMKEAKLEVGLNDVDIFPQRPEEHSHVEGKLKKKLMHRI